VHKHDRYIRYLRVAVDYLAQLLRTLLDSTLFVFREVLELLAEPVQLFGLRAIVR
jgi:hypothetical protein